MGLERACLTGQAFFVHLPISPPTERRDGLSIEVQIQWDRNQEDFTDGRYSRVHRWNFDGGQSVVASSSPDIVPLPFSDPSAVDPEEAFVASISSCHMLWFLSIAAKRRFTIDSYSDPAIGTMGKNESGQLVVKEVVLRPSIKWSGTIPTTEQVDSMHHEAHSSCFIANSVLTKITVNGS